MGASQPRPSDISSTASCTLCALAPDSKKQFSNGQESLATSSNERVGIAEEFKGSSLRSLRSARRLAREQKSKNLPILGEPSQAKLVAKMRRLINRNGCDLPYFPRVYLVEQGKSPSSPPRLSPLRWHGKTADKNLHRFHSGTAFRGVACRLALDFLTLWALSYMAAVSLLWRERCRRGFEE